MTTQQEHQTSHAAVKVVKESEAKLLWLSNSSSKSMLQLACAADDRAQQQFKLRKANSILRTLPATGHNKQRGTATVMQQACNIQQAQAAAAATACVVILWELWTQKLTHSQTHDALLWQSM
jgi:hypothetical protein